MNISKYLQDPSGYFFHHLNKRVINTSSWLSTRLLRIMLTLKHIQHGKGVITFGRTYFNRRPLSTIILGDNVKFRSAFI